MVAGVFISSSLCLADGHVPHLCEGPERHSNDFIWCIFCFTSVRMIKTIKICTKKDQNTKELLMDALKQGSDALFILLGAIMVLAMHAGFAFLELGTVRKKKPGQCLGQDSGRLLRFCPGLLCGGLWRCLWRKLHGGRRSAGRQKRL